MSLHYNDHYPYGSGLLTYKDEKPVRPQPRKLLLSKETLSDPPDGDPPQRDSQYGITCWEGECGPPPPVQEDI